MNSRPKSGFVAAAATLLAAAPLTSIFQYWTWLLQSLLVVGLMAGAAGLARSLRTPSWTPLLAMASSLLVALTWMFPSGTEALWILPTPGTFAHFGELLNGSVRDMQQHAVPVPDTDPLLFITALGVGAVAVVVDLLAVELRRPALAGLPMLAIYSVPVAVHTDSVPPVPFAFGAAGFLWLLVAENVERVRRFGRRFTGDGRDIDLWEPSPLAAAGRRLAVVGLALAVVLPLAIPNMTDGMLTGFGGIGGDGNGRGDGSGPGRINLFAALSGQLNQSEVRNLVKVTTDESEPFYLRFGVADDLRPDGFGVRSPSGREVTQALPDPRSDRPGGSYSEHRASVEITHDFDLPLLPVYGDLKAVRGLDTGWLYDPETQVVFSHRRRSKGEKYSFDYLRAHYTPAQLDGARSLPADHPMRQLTQVPQVPEVETLVKRLTRGKRSGYQRVRAIYDYFSEENGFRYQLSTKGGTSGQDIVNFLNGRAGFCQQYAAAMAWLVRAAGIPARVAFGFTNGSSRDGNTFTLTNLNLHAWTEVYFDGFGWVPFDATPAAAVPGSTRSAWAPDTDAPDPVPTSPDSTAGPATGPSTGPGGPNRHDKEFDNGLTAGGPTNDRTPTWPGWLAAGLAMLLALLAAPALRRAALRRRRHAAARSASATPLTDVMVGETAAQEGRAPAHAAWAELVDLLVDFGVRVDPAETPRAMADRLVAEHLPADPAAEAARRLGLAEERARYARTPLREVRLSEALRIVRGALAAEADRRTRVLATLLPPSIVRRWRLGVLETSTRMIAGSGRARDGLLRFSPRRLLAGRVTR